MLTIMKI